VKNLSYSASFHSLEHIAPSNPGIKHPVRWLAAMKKQKKAVALGVIMTWQAALKGMHACRHIGP
jgi:hypothetical protein